MTKTMTAVDRKLFVRIAKRSQKTDAYIYTHEERNFVRNHLRLFVTHPDVDLANPEMFMFQLSEQGRALFRKLMPPRIPAITILLIACLSANGVFAQQAPDFFNRAERLEDVPGVRKTDIREIIPVRDFMSVEQYELTLPSRARARGFTLLAKQAAQGDYSPKGQPTTIREELRLPCGRIIILYKEYDAIPPSKSNQ